MAVYEFVKVDRRAPLDRIHGAHVEKDTIILSHELGGGSFAHVPFTTDVCPGELYLVYQECDPRSRFTGDLLMSAEPVSRELAVSICSSWNLTGSLSIYTCDREDARALMSDSIRKEPREYSFTGPQLSQELFCWRHPHPYYRGINGPMVLYGTVRAMFGQNEHIENERKMGYTIDNGFILITRDLGGLSLPAVELDRWNHVAEPGRFYAVTSMPKALSEGRYVESYISTVEIPYKVALAICIGTNRLGMLNVYTPNRQDALNLMNEAIQTSPRELVDRKVLSFKASMFVNPRLNESVSPKVIYGHIDGGMYL